MSRFTYVCARCGLAVYPWRDQGSWKHATGGAGGKSCGQVPVAVKRNDYAAGRGRIEPQKLPTQGQ